MFPYLQIGNCPIRCRLDARNWYRAYAHEHGAYTISPFLPLRKRPILHPVQFDLKIQGCDESSTKPSDQAPVIGTIH